MTLGLAVGDKQGLYLAIESYGLPLLESWSLLAKVQRSPEQAASCGADRRRACPLERRGARIPPAGIDCVRRN